MKDPIEALDSFYEECRHAEPSERHNAEETVRWLGFLAATAVGVAMTVGVVVCTPKPRTDESAAAQFIQESQLVQRAGKEKGLWRG